MMADRRVADESLLQPLARLPAACVVVSRRPADGEPCSAPAAGGIRASTEATTLAGRGPTLLVGGRADVGAMARASAVGAAGDGDRMASHGLAAVLDVEESNPSPWAGAHQPRAARAH